MAKQRNPKIGIVGLGSVGSPLKLACEQYFENVIGYDKVGNHGWQQILDCDVVFVCVPTPGGEDGRLDCTCVEEVLGKLGQDSFVGVVAIKSTLRIGFMSQAISLHTKLRLVYCPEFLRETSRLQWTFNPDRIVVAGSQRDTDEVLKVFTWAQEARIIVTDYSSAEVGKLAHNSFIANKVSFTNEMERISAEKGANPEHVMDIITADRRVISKEHLRPYLGPYGGKCVPKDTRELMTASNSELLRAVENVNATAAIRYNKPLEEYAPFRTSQENNKIIVIIATRSRHAQLVEALKSVAGQTRQPDQIIIVGEETNDFPINKQSIESEIHTKTHWLLNKRTRNLAGAINTAVEFLLREDTDPETTFLAFLDDDDTWNPDYLQANREQAIQERDIVISGIIRHEAKGDQGTKLTIPKSLTPQMFLVGNPHVQGSNLFVRMSTFMKAGGFDENLPSTTDRDLMIRLLDLGNIDYTCLPVYLVHHHADSPSRLSSYRSEAKLTGLTRFWQKYKNRMTEEQAKMFIERSQTRFGWNAEVQNTQESSTSMNISPIPRGKTSHKFHLVVGFTASHAPCTSSLLKDLTAFLGDFPNPVSLVVLDNTDSQEIDQLIQKQATIFSTVKVVLKEEVEKAADSAKLGSFYKNKKRRKGVSFGRTALHRFLYLTGISLDNPVFWILDDDIRVNNMVFASNHQKVSPSDFAGLINSLIEDDIAISVGGIMGDPPLPVASSIRVQLLELDSALRTLSINQLETESKPDADASSFRFPDAYYDLSTRHYDHLETPLRLWALPGADPNSLVKSAVSIMEGRNLLRPALPNHMNNSDQGEVIMRGGNTIVTDIECLRTYPNSSPQINGVELRRGDSVWVTLNQCLGGKLVGFEEKRVVMALPLFLTQERVSSPKLKLLSNNFAADIQGGAFVRAFSNLLKRKLENIIEHGPGIIGTVLRFSEENCKNVTKETIQNIETRKTILKLNAWRTSGLISAIRYQINNTLQENPTIATQKESMKNLRKMLDWVEQEMPISAVNEFCRRLSTGVVEGVEEFMLELDNSREQYSSSLPLRARDKQKRMAIQFIAKCVNASSLRLVGEGQEGIVYTDGQKAYKYFISNISQVKNATREIIKTKLNPTSELKRIVPVEKLIVDKNEMLIVMPYIEGTQYNGDNLIELLELLRECKRAGIILTNLCPENLIVGENGPVYIDIGRSVVPYQESLFIQMCKRAYLTFRWHYRTDLKELLTRSLHETDLAELFGFDEFMKALNQTDFHSQMDPMLTELCLKSGAKKVLDFGCGSGSLADKLARRGLTVDCYDPNESRFLRHSHEPTVKIVRIAELKPNFSSNSSYDLVLGSLVLCSIESEKEVEQALSDMRELVSNNGKIIVSICNPFAVGVHTSPSQIRENSCDSEYNASFSLLKKILRTSGQRKDHHRSLDWYVQTARKAGLEIEEVFEVPSVDVERLSPSSDQIILVFQPVKIPVRRESVSLMIKACAMEWQTIEKQVRHIVRQLEDPQKFVEKVLLMDAATEGFARTYGSANWGKFKQAAENLLEEGVIDRIVEAPLVEEEVERINLKWFGLRCNQPKSANGQPTYTTLYGFEKCSGDYVLQLDSDCIIHRASRNHDYLAEILSVFKKNPLAVTVSIPIAQKNKQPFRRERNGRSFRVETRCSLLDLRRLQSLLPLTNEVDSGVLKLPWHRSLDIAVSEGRATSYRGGDPQTCFIHVPNSRKSDVNSWISTIDCVEHGILLEEQMGNVDLVGQTADWMGRRNEEMVIILRGKDVPISKIRRCLQSLQGQSFQKWSAVIVNAGSNNGTNDFCQYVIRRSLGSRVSFVSNHIAVTAMENIDFVTSEVCTNPLSIIVHLDLDDALIGENALDKIVEAYRNGADVTVGSVLRTDKQANYSVSFENPRANRGGNVWQHLRTYRKYLYDKVPKDYFKINGEWVPHTEDWAFMIPIVELARNPVNIKDMIYFYEPSEQKMHLAIEAREQIVAKLIAKPRLEVKD